jgi:very-short-patch-repair endonuclease
MATLRRLAEGKAIESADPENEKLESFLEIEFFERLSKAKLPAPTLQVVRELGKRPIIRVDAVYRDPNISIFLDGRAFHAQVREKIESDLETRNRLEAAGELVLEFTFDDVINHFDEVAETIQQALSGRSGDGQVDPKALEGLNVADVDQTRREIGITIDADAWLSDAASWRTSLASANRLRLAGWRLSRTLGEVSTG